MAAIAAPFRRRYTGQVYRVRRVARHHPATAARIDQGICQKEVPSPYMFQIHHHWPRTHRIRIDERQTG
jgi:hypothetical protein